MASSLDAAMRRRTKLLMLCALGSFAALCLGANLLYVAASVDCGFLLQRCAAADPPWHQPDSNEYLRLAKQLGKEGPNHLPVDSRSPGYPSLLFVATAITGEPAAALWLAVLAGALAAACIAWLATRWTGRPWLGVPAVLLFCLWPHVYRFSPLLITDALHAFGLVIALAATAEWRRTERPGWVLASGVAWLLVQSLRHNFFIAPALIPLLLWKSGSSPGYRRLSVALCLATVVLPSSVVLANASRHGKPIASTKLYQVMTCETIPMLKTWAGLDFREEREKCMRRYQAMPVGRRVDQQMLEVRGIFSLYPRQYLTILLHSFLTQMSFEMRPWELKAQGLLYPAWLLVPSFVMVLYWLLAAGGLALLSRREPGLVVFLLAVVVVVMVPASFTHTAGGRLRLPLDIVFMPVVVFCVERIVGATRRSFRSRSGSA